MSEDEIENQAIIKKSDINTFDKYLNKACKSVCKILYLPKTQLELAFLLSYVKMKKN